MKILIQKVLSACVEVEKEVVGKIAEGYLLYVGITHSDTEKECQLAIERLLHLRLFPDTEEVHYFDRNIQEAKGEILVVSQFTLYGNLDKGRRPSFDAAMRPGNAEKIYNYFVESLQKHYPERVSTGRFGSHMYVSSINNGPVTFILEL